jgi:hypothetical protein
MPMRATQNVRVLERVLASTTVPGNKWNPLGRIKVKQFINLYLEKRSLIKMERFRT